MMAFHIGSEVRSGCRTHRLAFACAALGMVTIAGTAQAVDFSKGALTGSWDTTISYGTAWRIQDSDCNQIAVADGGCGRSPNIDDGDLNFGTGSYSRVFKLTSELGLNYGDFGFFVRGSALYDDYVENSPTERTPLTPHAKNLVGEYVRLLDAFAYWRPNFGGKPSEFRLGRQVVSWGESTFIQGGINNINHFDVSALRQPGAELKEGFLPQEMAFFSLGLTQNTSLEGLYLFDWNDTRPEPVGSYWSSNDFVPVGGSKVVLGFGGFSDQGVDFRPLGGPFITNFQAVPRGPTIEPDKDGQYGVALRTFFPGFLNGTEFGLYFINYHSRLPLISGRSGTQAGIGNAAGAVTAVGGAAQGLAAGLPLQAAIGTAAAAAVQRSAAAGGNMSITTATQYATIGANYALQGVSPADISRNASNIATHEFAETASYFTEFPEDIKLFGLSFNTQFQNTGIALQGEVSYRQDVPLQFDDVELLFAALTPLEVALFPLSAPGVPFPTTCNSTIPTLSRCGQLGQFGVNQLVQGWETHDVWQGQFTMTKIFAQILGASQFVTVLEAAYTHVDGMEDKLSGGPNARGLRFNGPGTSVSGNFELRGRHCPQLPAAQCLALDLVEPQNRFADADSWGYRVAGRLEYPNAMGPWTLIPRFFWQHDVDGTTPGPGGAFVEGRYALTLGLTANLQNTWEVDLSWSKYGGAGRYNDINDRDFVAATLKVSF
ncbi:MAG TPA: DUF1302 domain-containing protein [Steroidobacteraceae bacterium]|nr:DUF1302 domain-containing protein [Steroidobacteraceae bacterium]